MLFVCLSVCLSGFFSHKWKFSNIVDKQKHISKNYPHAKKKIYIAHSMSMFFFCRYKNCAILGIDKNILSQIYLKCISNKKLAAELISILIKKIENESPKWLKPLLILKDMYSILNLLKILKFYGLRRHPNFL